MTASELRAEIARLQRVMSDWNIEGRLDSDTEADIKAEIDDLYDDLSDIEQTRIEPEYAATGGLNLDLFAKAIGATPEELGWDEAA